MAIATLIISGCEALDPAVGNPSYIRINSFDLKTNYALEGSDDHNIVDAWLLVGDTSLGAYELPAIIPVLSSGKTEIRLFAGIKDNGIASTRVIYPFYDDTTFTVTLIPGSTIDLTPQISYYPDLTFEWLEDFEFGTLLETNSSSASISLESVTAPPAMGTKSAVIHVTAAEPNFFGATSNEQFLLPIGFPVYLEFNYASNIEFSVGAIKMTVFGPEILDPFYNVFPSGEWNKIYVNLTSYIQGETDAVSFEIYFSCVYDDSISNNTLLLDNIKLVYR